jgi:uncharacterized protein YndB with AHSA1/START domain
MSDPDLVTLRVVRRIPVSAETIYDAFIDQDKLGRWLRMETDELIACEAEPRVGGKLRLVVRRDGEEVEHIGEYRELDRPRRLAFTWAVPRYGDHVSLVRVELAPAGGVTELTLTHERVLPEYRDRTAQGWNLLLGRLEALL